jgi:sulfatase maturation enzyme AslB (radical SAM superfamily)
MANVLITDHCNRNCSYCFAKQEMGDQNEKRSGHMSLENFERVMQFCRRSDLKTVGILGGEPTLHPDFTSIIDQLLKEGLYIKVFTGGLLPPKVEHYLKNLSTNKLNMIINVSYQSEYSSTGIFDQVRKTVHSLAMISTLGYTIYDLNTDFSFLVELIMESKCRPRIRLGMGVPALDGIHPIIHPDHYKLIAQRILRLAKKCDLYDIAIDLDCGFILCMFTPEELGYLRSWNCNANFSCSPIIDIGPTLDVWSCFPLSKMHKTHLEKFSTRQELINHFEEKTMAFRSFGLYDQCHTCKHKKRGQCGGGCLSHTIRSFNRGNDCLPAT